VVQELQVTRVPEMALGAVVRMSGKLKR
jgi:hypothetical protein